MEASAIDIKAVAVNGFVLDAMRNLLCSSGGDPLPIVVSPKPWNHDNLPPRKMPAAMHGIPWNSRRDSTWSANMLERDGCRVFVICVFWDSLRVVGVRLNVTRWL